MSKYYLELINLSYSYGFSRVLHNLNLNIKQRECICLLGKNGSGKSTFLRSLTQQRIWLKQKAQLKFQGQEISNQKELLYYLHQCAYLGHSSGLFLDLTIRENLSFFAKLSGLKSSSVLALILQWIEAFNLIEHQDTLVRHLSQGLKQRAALASIFLRDRPIIYLDEPLQALDVRSIALFQKILQATLKQNRTILLSTHRPELYKNSATRYLVINKGHLVADLSSEQFKNQEVYSKVKSLL